MKALKNENLVSGFSEISDKKKSRFIYVHRQGESYREFVCLMEIIREVMRTTVCPVYLLENDRRSLMYYDMYIQTTNSEKIRFIFNDHIPSESILDSHHQDPVVCFFDGNIDVFAETKRVQTEKTMLCLFRKRIKTRDVICHAVNLGLDKLFVVALDYDSTLVVSHFHKVLDQIGVMDLEVCELGSLNETDFSPTVSLGRHRVKLGIKERHRMAEIAKGILLS